MRQIRGREAAWAWRLHRLTGLGVLVFLCLHVVDTALLLAGEGAYNHLITTVYRAWWFQPAEIALGAALVYHALNGVRLILLDFWDDAIRHERRLRLTMVGAFVAVVVPLATVMLWPFVVAS